jgi:hypothetical protein
MTPPFVLGILASSQVIAAAGDYESIATVTVGSGGAANVEFTSIPGTYTHLQVRGIARTDAAVSLGSWRIQFNGDTGANYKGHYLYGDGSAVGSGGASYIQVGIESGASATASIFGAGVLDILDYANTNKNTVTRSISGTDLNGSGEFDLLSGLWLNTAAVTSIKLFPATGNFVQYSHFALYGCKI